METNYRLFHCTWNSTTTTTTSPNINNIPSFSSFKSMVFFKETFGLITDLYGLGCIFFPFNPSPPFPFDGFVLKFNFRLYTVWSRDQSYFLFTVKCPHSDGILLLSLPDSHVMANYVANQEVSRQKKSMSLRRVTSDPD